MNDDKLYSVCIVLSKKHFQKIAEMSKFCGSMSNLDDIDVFLRDTFNKSKEEILDENWNCVPYGQCLGCESLDFSFKLLVDINRIDSDSTNKVHEIIVSAEYIGKHSGVANDGTYDYSNCKKYTTEIGRCSYQEPEDLKNLLENDLLRSIHYPEAIEIYIVENIIKSRFYLYDDEDASKYTGQVFQIKSIEPKKYIKDIIANSSLACASLSETLHTYKHNVFLSCLLC